jgi:hypothetical protein
MTMEQDNPNSEPDVLDALCRHIAMMAPHQKDRHQGRLVIEARDEIRRLREGIDSVANALASRTATNTQLVRMLRGLLGADTDDDPQRSPRPYDAPDVDEHERLLTEDTEVIDTLPDCGLPRHTRLRLLAGTILPTTAAMVQYHEHAREKDHA